EGWFIVSSTESALRYSKEHAIVATGQAMAQLQGSLAARTKTLGKDLAQAGEAGVQSGTTLFSTGTEITKKTFATTHATAEAAWEIGGEAMNEAWHTLIRGNLSLVQRTQSDRNALSALPGKYFSDLSSDFHNLGALAHQAKAAASSRIEGKWAEAYAEAAVAFASAYQQSGTRGNSLTALGDILVGYLKVAYSGLIKPATRSVVQGGEATAKTVAEVVFLPTAGVFIVSGRTIQSLGLSLYYTTAMGVSLVSPTIEGGLLAGLSLLSYGAVPASYLVGGTLGAVNQVAVTAAAPLVGAGHTLVQGGAHTVEYAALVSTDIAGGATKVTLNQVQAGVALGYNALTALPTQLALGAANSVVFLAWDGPRLVLATARGEVRWQANSQTHSLSVQSLPVGSVVDMRALGDTPGVKVETLSEDPAVIQEVLEKLPEDLRVGTPP
ncbi:MAG: hypothetical protein OEW08_12320, partial [Gammaproteobacteria bacterium]|nr:hypothetical protein [Gammaproteobacteria bacterium]